MNCKENLIVKKKNKVKVLIIDSYISRNHPKILNDEIIEIRTNFINVDESLGHGTAIYGILRKKMEIAQFYSLPINDNLSEEELIQILSYVANYNITFDIINISLGISFCKNYTLLYAICEKLVKKGSILISAFNNDGSISFPAAFDNVIGVTSSNNCIAIDEFEYYEDSVLNIGAKGGIQRLLWNNPKYIFLSGNSFACAYVTSKAIQFLYEEKCNYMDLMDKFKEISKSIYKYTTRNDYSLLESVPFSIKKAALFPFNKEMHSLLRFKELLSFEIINVYDSKKSIYLGRMVSEILDGVESNLIIKSIKDFDYMNIDTIIVGHIDSFNNEDEKKSFIHFILDLIEKGVNIYSFENILKTNQNKNYFYPRINSENTFPYREGMLYHITTPILGFMGTTSSQGKFTLQLEIRKRLLKEGYLVGEIGTEPSSLLFSMDAVIPMGYNSTVEIVGKELINYVNNVLFKISKKNVEIILAGAQAGTLCYDTGNLSRFNIDIYSYMLAIDPDFIILSFNSYDDIEYLARTVSFIESAFNTKVIALVMFPLELKDGYFSLFKAKQYVSNDKYINLKRSLESKIGINVYRLDDCLEINDLYEHIIKNFE